MKELHFLKTRLIAHRGIYDNKRIYENTISAIQRAIKHQYIIEFDVRLLSDGTCVVFHDQNMERLLHVEGNIERITYDELCYIAKYQVPTLEEVLDLVAGSVPILIDLKTVTSKRLLEKKVAIILDEYKGNFAVQSFHIRTLKWFYKNRPNYITGYLINRKNLTKNYFFKKYDFVNINIKLLSDRRVKKLKEDKMVIGYTINTKEEYALKQNIYDNLVCNNILEIDPE